VTQRISCGEWVDLDCRSAVLTIRSQIIQAFEATAFTLPVANLVLNEIERGRASKVRDWKDRLKDGLQSCWFSFFGQKIHLQKAIV
jgi:hypothetical protein